MNVTVIIPTYNEKDNITPLLEAVFTAAKKVTNHTISVLVVDDNSPDGTGEIVKKLQSKYKALQLISGKKEGLGRAYFRGMKFASETMKAEVMFEMDADFQHDPSLIPMFLKKIDQGYDVVIGSRYIKGGSIPSNWGIHRKIYSVLGNLIVQLFLFNFSQKDWTTGYRAIRTPVYKKIRSQLEEFKGYTFQVSFLHKAYLNHAKITEVPIKFIDRVHGESKIGSSEYIFNLIKYLIISDLTNPPAFYRFLVVGTLGFLIQTTIYTFFWKIIGLPPHIAVVIGAEFAIISNFILNNFWTFSESKLEPKLSVILPKFLSFNILSAGSPVIQFITIRLTNLVFSTSDLATWIAYITGIFLGLIWNYIMYSRVIWKKKPASKP